MPLHLAEVYSLGLEPVINNCGTVLIPFPERLLSSRTLLYVSKLLAYVEPIGLTPTGTLSSPYIVVFSCGVYGPTAFKLYPLLSLILTLLTDIEPAAKFTSNALIPPVIADDVSKLPAPSCCLLLNVEGKLDTVVDAGKLETVVDDGKLETVVDEGKLLTLTEPLTCCVAGKLETVVDDGKLETVVDAGKLLTLTEPLTC
jgi:hypothetical protein